MPTEPNAVSDLVHQMQTRRLGTDPADAALFEAPASQRAPLPAPRPFPSGSIAPPVARRVSSLTIPPPVGPRGAAPVAPAFAFAATMPAPARVAPTSTAPAVASPAARFTAPASSPAIAPRFTAPAVALPPTIHDPIAPFSGSTRIARPIAAPTRAASPGRRAVAHTVVRDRIWPWVTATFLAAILGGVGAAYLRGVIDDDVLAPSSPAPVVVTAAAPSPLADRAPVAPPAPPPTEANAAPAVPPAAAPIAAPAAPPADASTAAADAISSADPVAAGVKQPAIVDGPQKSAKAKRGAKKRIASAQQKAKPKVGAKAKANSKAKAKAKAKSESPKPEPRATAAVNEPAKAVEAARPAAPKRPARQSVDSEDPL